MKDRKVFSADLSFSLQSKSAIQLRQKSARKWYIIVYGNFNGLHILNGQIVYTKPCAAMDEKVCIIA